MKVSDIIRKDDDLAQLSTSRCQTESASAGATSAGSIASVANPHISPGRARGKKSYTGSIATGSGTKSPPQPKVVQKKNPDGTIKGAHEQSGSLFGSAVKR